MFSNRMKSESSEMACKANGGNEIYFVTEYNQICSPITLVIIEFSLIFACFENHKF